MLVIDAEMIGARQMERVIFDAKTRGAKVVLVGDVEQLQTIEADPASEPDLISQCAEADALLILARTRYSKVAIRKLPNSRAAPCSKRVGPLMKKYFARFPSNRRASPILVPST